MPVPENVNDHYQTPWGLVYWVGDPPHKWDRHGWMFGPRTGKPMGKPLPNPDKEAEQRELLVTEADNGKVVGARGLRKVVIRLAGNPTTGYTWALAELVGQSLKQQGQIRFVPGRAKGLVGAGGHTEITFVAVKPGLATVSMHYKRPWEKIKPAKVFNVRVNVRPTLEDERFGFLKTDLDALSLSVRYFGPEDKSYYRLTVFVADFKSGGTPNWPWIQISREQGRAIIEHLRNEGFLREADETTGKKIKAPKGPAYTLTLNGYEERQYHLDLGWGPIMLRRMESLGKILKGKPAAAMAKLLNRLRPERANWKTKDKKTGGS